MKLYIVTTPNTAPALYKAFEIHEDDRTGHFTHHLSTNIAALVEELETIEPRPEITFDTRARLAFWRSLD